MGQEFRAEKGGWDGDMCTAWFWTFEKSGVSTGPAAVLIRPDVDFG